MLQKFCISQFSTCQSKVLTTVAKGHALLKTILSIDSSIVISCIKRSFYSIYHEMRRSRLYIPYLFPMGTMGRSVVFPFLSMKYDSAATHTQMHKIVVSFCSAIFDFRINIQWLSYFCHRAIVQTEKSNDIGIWLISFRCRSVI